MSGKDYNVYQGADDIWRGKRQDASKASVTGTTQKEVFEATRALAEKAGSEVSIHRGDNNQIRPNIATAMIRKKQRAKYRE